MMISGMYRGVFFPRTLPSEMDILIYTISVSRNPFYAVASPSLSPPLFSPTAHLSQALSLAVLAL